MNWLKEKELIIKQLRDGEDPIDIAKKLKVNESDLRQFIHRHRLFSQKEEKNLAFEVINILMRGNTDYFRPNREFFKSVKIRQKRWWALFRGDKVITEVEYINLVTHLGITYHEAFEARQFNWLDELENKRNVYKRNK